MARQAVLTDKAPKPGAHNSQAIVANGFVFCSGQTPKDVTGKFNSEGTVQDHTVSIHKPVPKCKHCTSRERADPQVILSVNASRTWELF